MAAAGLSAPSVATAVTQLRRNAEAWTRVAAILVGIALVAVATTLGATIYDGMLVFVFVLALVHSASIVLALISPPVAAGLSLAASLGLMVSTAVGSSAPWPWTVTTMITQALVLGLVGFRAPWMLGGATLVASVALAGIVAAVVRPPHEPNATAVNMVIFASVAGTTLIGGIVWRQWRVIRSQLVRERRLTEEERTLRVVAEEKTRIARELHDVIAHSMSIITVQASSAPFRHPQADAELRDEFEDIAASSRRALAEMRSLLRVLRNEAETAEKAPQPVLSRIPELVEQSTAAGMTVRLVGGELLRDEGVGELTGLTAYRIVQEALSNVIRHAPGAEVLVECTRDDDAIEVVVRNTRPQQVGSAATTIGAPPAAEPGHGLIGMRERAASVGGSVSAGATDDGGYRVRARLPLHSAETTTAPRERA